MIVMTFMTLKTIKFIKNNKRKTIQDIKCKSMVNKLVYLEFLNKSGM